MFKIILLFILIESLFGKSLHYTLDLRQLVGKKWIYLARFAASPGTGTLDARVKINSKNIDQDYIPLEFLVYEEVSWGLYNYIMIIIEFKMNQNVAINKNFQSLGGFSKFLQTEDGNIFHSYFQERKYQKITILKVLTKVLVFCSF